MITEINDSIEVAAVFRKGGLEPVWFVWRGKKYPIQRITYRWKGRSGEGWLYSFSVFDGTNTFELVYDAKTLQWKLGRVSLD